MVNDRDYYGSKHKKILKNENSDSDSEIHYKKRRREDSVSSASSASEVNYPLDLNRKRHKRQKSSKKKEKHNSTNSDSSEEEKHSHSKEFRRGGKRNMNRTDNERNFRIDRQKNYVEKEENFRIKIRNRDSDDEELAESMNTACPGDREERTNTPKNYIKEESLSPSNIKEERKYSPRDNFRHQRKYSNPKDDFRIERKYTEDNISEEEKEIAKEEPNMGLSGKLTEPVKKEGVSMELSGKLAEDSNTYKGVVIKYSQPPEARKPKRKWRWYIFKGDQEIPFLPLHRQSAYLIGRDRKIADIPTDHPSCSKQHAVLQYRLVNYERPDGTNGRTVKPYIIDLESANGTYLNATRIEAKRFIELREKDVIKFGYSSREYVLLHEASKGSDGEDKEDF